MDKENI